jgi:uncharacterized cupin superfamily protein
MVYKRNLEEVDWMEMGHGERFFHRRKALTPYSEPYKPKLGMSFYRLEPGKRAFPFHRHFANDEVLLITKGTGSLRYGEEMVPLGEGDYVYLPAEAGVAHQVVNTGADALEYFCISTMLMPEVVMYPDSNKVATSYMTSAEDGAGHERKFFVLRYDAVGYWDGEQPE